MDGLSVTLRQAMQGGKMDLGKNGEFTFGHGEFELLMLFRKICSGNRYGI